MQKRFRYVLLFAAALLIAFGISNGQNRDAFQPYPHGEGSVSLGLVLLDDAQGVYVLAISDQSLADQAGFAPGDYIIRADGRHVENTVILNELLKEKSGSIEMTVQRHDGQMNLTLPRR